MASNDLPAQCVVDKMQQGDESNQVGSNVGYQEGTGAGAGRGSFDDVPLRAERKEETNAEMWSAIRSTARSPIETCDQEHRARTQFLRKAAPGSTGECWKRHLAGETAHEHEFLSYPTTKPL